MLDNLADEIQIDASQKNRVSEPKSCDDSGFGDDGSLDSWRMQSEAIVRFNE